jgi:hypothetical protein
MKKEESFWNEFLKNQKNNDTEIFGGLKALYFTNEDRARIAEARQFLGDTAFHSGYIKQIPKNYKLGKTPEAIERNRLYTSNYMGPCLAIAEFDYKDKEMKEKNPEEEFNKKELNNLIENINNYSMRKLEGNNFISRESLVRRNRAKDSIVQKKSNNTPGLVENFNIDGIYKINSVTYNKVYNKFLEMKSQQQHSQSKEVNKKDSIEAYKKVQFFLILDK